MVKCHPLACQAAAWCIKSALAPDAVFDWFVPEIVLYWRGSRNRRLNSSSWLAMLSLANAIRTYESQWNGDEQPETEKSEQCSEWDGRRRAFCPEHQIRDKKDREENAK